MFYSVYLDLVIKPLLLSTLASNVLRLPGRTLAKGQSIWLCNAHFADSKVFSRSLLAKVEVAVACWD